MYLGNFILKILFILSWGVERWIKVVPFCRGGETTCVCAIHQSRRRRLSAASGFSLLRVSLDTFKFFFAKLIVVVIREPLFALLPIFLRRIFLLLLLGPIGIYCQSVLPVPINTAVLLRLWKWIGVPHVIRQPTAEHLLLLYWVHRGARRWRIHFEIHPVPRIIASIRK